MGKNKKWYLPRHIYATTRLAAERPAAVEPARHEAQYFIEYRTGAA
jgi:hypothetical protein